MDFSGFDHHESIWNNVNAQQRSSYFKSEMFHLMLYLFTYIYFFIDSTGTDTTGNTMKERWSDMQQRAPGWHSNLGLL